MAKNYLANIFFFICKHFIFFTNYFFIFQPILNLTLHFSRLNNVASLQIEVCYEVCQKNA